MSKRSSKSSKSSRSNRPAETPTETPTETLDELANHLLSDRPDNGLSSANPSNSSARGPMTNAERLDLYMKVLESKDLSKLPTEKIREMRQRLNPYGRTIAGSDKFLNFSITQISHEYWKKLVTTSMIGYLNRMCDEWKVPAGIPVVSVYDYIEKPTALDTPEIITNKGNQSILYDYEFNRAWMQKRIIVKEFLEEMFQFNPDEHVRSAYRPNYKDTTRTPLDTMAARLAVDTATNKDTDLRNAKQEFDEAAGVITKKVRKTIRGRDGKVRTVVRDVPIESKPPVGYTETPTEPLDPNKPRDPSVTSTVTNMIPPADMFGRFKMYMQENYEELREAVLALYCEKPEFELAINPYSWHSTKEEAEAFKKQHAEEVIAEVFTAESGKWNLFDSFKTQRESVNFYNKNTIVLEEMANQIKRDEMIGQELMSKRVEKEKKKNIIESGPDAENFKQWRKDNSDLSKLGAKHLGDMADDDMPEDSVQVDVWRIAKGGLELTKDKFYSQSEAPKFVQNAQEAYLNGSLDIPAGVTEGSPAVESRADNL